MANKVIEEVQFFHSHKKQHINKSKLKEEIVQKAWGARSAGFDETVKDKGLTCQSDNNILFHRSNLENLRQKLLGNGYKSIKRKSMAEIGNLELDSFLPQSKMQSGIIHKNSLQNLHYISNVCKERQNSLVSTSNANSPSKDLKKLLLRSPIKVDGSSSVKLGSQAHSACSKLKNGQNKGDAKMATLSSLSPPSANSRSKSNQNPFQKDLADIRRKLLNLNDFRKCRKRTSSDCTNILFPKDSISAVVKCPVAVQSERFVSDISSDNYKEEENVLKKRKVFDFHFEDVSFSFPSPFPAKEVQKKHIIPPVSSSWAAKSDSIPKKLVNSLESSTRKLDLYIVHSDKSSTDLEFHPSEKHCFLSKPSGSKSCFNESSCSKGSNWVQSIQHIPLTDTDNWDRVNRKKLRNLLEGGFAEQMLKLQRRERSEKVIWEHKINKNNDKVSKNTISVLITSLAYVGEMVITKCTFLDISTHSIEKNEDDISLCTSLVASSTNRVEEYSVNDANIPSSKVCIVLFKRIHFNHLRLKVNDAFQIHQPWQIVNTSKCPVILCTYFVNHLVQSSENKISEEKVFFKNTGGNKLSTTNEVPYISEPKGETYKDSNNSINCFFFRWGETLTLFGRVQRIWHHKINLDRLVNFPHDAKHYRFSILVQDKEGMFHEVLFTSAIPVFWQAFISSAEGKCFRFHGLHIGHRMHRKNHPDLFEILETLSQQQSNGAHPLNQEFCYQLMCNTSSKVPEEVKSEDCAAYCVTPLQPLSSLQRESTIQRFSCIVKILFQQKSTFFISDSSLFHTTSRYFRLQLLFPFDTKSLMPGSIIKIKDALFLEGLLHLDKYSSITLCHPAADSSVPEISNSILQKLASVTLENIVSPLNRSSQITDLVSVEGEIMHVDETGAFTWLQCSFCLQENLVQDANLVIYCEDCSCMVPMPILNVKMEVTLLCKNTDSLIAKVQLLSTTIKRILQIEDNVQQPHRSVHDVLGKSIGPLMCYLRSCESIKNVFHLSEIPSA